MRSGTKSADHGMPKRMRGEPTTGDREEGVTIRVLSSSRQRGEAQYDMRPANKADGEPISHHAASQFLGVGALGSAGEGGAGQSKSNSLNRTLGRHE